MLFLLVRKELRDHLRSLRFAMACLICPAVVLSSLFALARDYGAAALDYGTNLALHRKEVVEFTSPLDLTNRGIEVDKPLNPLKVFFNGVDDTYTTTVRVSATAEPEYQSESDPNPISLLFPVVDLGFVGVVIMSLLAIAFSYDGIAGEKERGTLRLVMSYSVPRDLVLLSKWLGGYLAMTAPFVFSVLLGLVLVALVPQVGLQGEEWAALALALGGALAYLSAVYSLGLLVSCRARESATAIAVLLLVWIAMVLVLPNLCPYAAGLVRPTPALETTAAEKAKLEETARQDFQEQWQAWLATARKNRRSFSAIIAQYRTMASQTEGRLTAERGKVDERYRRAQAEQTSLARRLANVSPAAIYTLAAADLSATGIQEQEHFRDQLARYAGQWSEYAFGKFDSAVFRGQKRLDASDYPLFVYEPLPLTERLRESAVEMLALAIWNLVFFMGAYLSFMRYDLR